MEEEYNLIQNFDNFDSCDEFEIMAVEKDLTETIEKVEVRRNPQSHQIKALKALVKIESHILNMTIDTGSPVSFLNWATTKKNLEGPTNSKFIPASTINVLF